MAGATTERTTTDKGGPFQPPKDVKAASTDFLIAELVNNRMTSETAEELERRRSRPISKLALRIAKIVESREKQGQSNMAYLQKLLADAKKEERTQI